MIPSLAAGQLREAIVEYLTTTFAIGDEETREALQAFLEDEQDGIFRGPFLHVRTPFRRVDPGWSSPLDLLPAGFVPFVHQAQAFARLSTRDHEPRPTIVTTGTGSGKTECFLLPILDHCARAVNAGQPGIKALILYPMNALATDQAGRLAGMIAADSRLAGVTAGLFVGGESANNAVMTPTRLIDDRKTLRDVPPDILLTNYKMLDFLLLRDTDRGLWAETGPGVLRHVVLDEFHTYDGAQGTDVAMLLRRLGATLSLAGPAGPLGAVAPVATSATLGSGASETIALREFAGRVFGTEFGPDAVISEQRQTVGECCLPVAYELPVPDTGDLSPLDGTDPDALAAAFTGRSPADAVALGETLLAHRLTRAVLGAAGTRPTPVRDAVDEIAVRVPEWGPTLALDRPAVERAVALYLALLSIARRPGPGGKPVPLFSVEVQLWIREVSRVTRLVQEDAAFRWLDGAAPEPDPDELPQAQAPTAPAIYCRLCGRTGWMARASEMLGSLSLVESGIYEESVRASPRLRAMIRASSEEPGVQHLHPGHVTLHAEAQPDRIAVLVTPDDDAARRSQCPSCDGAEGIRFLGSRVASLASVSISQLFGSELVADGERKLLAFTDSVQDAAHRAAFFNGRTHRFNQRIALTSAVRDAGGTLALSEVAPELLREAGSDTIAIYGLTPPDLLRHAAVRTLWEPGNGAPGARDLLVGRLAFEAHLEFGLRARLGRTTELTGTLAAEVPIAGLERLGGLLLEARDDLVGQLELLPDPDAADDPAVYLRGLAERLRLQGAIFHPWLKSYVLDEGRRYKIWGGRPDGLPAFPSGQSAPTFAIDATQTPFDALDSRGTASVWTADWAARTLRVPLTYARELTKLALGLLREHGVVSTLSSTKGHTVYGLEASAITVNDVAVDESVLRCRVCAHRHAAPPDSAGAWENTPCLRYRCPGRYERLGRPASAYYRRLYRSGSPRRTVAAEHTGGLDRPTREALERAFKSGSGPGTPNVLACTPTLEMGVDIGDLSAVMLTSVPRSSAAYVQRVGRAGRASGNALVTTFVRTEPRSLYFLTDPRHMIAGAVRPPSCWLDAIEILRRQFLAYVFDRAADGTIAAPPLPRQIGQLVKGLEAGDGTLPAVLAAAGDHAAGFLSGFGTTVSAPTAARLVDHAAGPLEERVRERVADWNVELSELNRRRDRLRDRIAELEQRASLTDDEEVELRALRGERRGVVRRLQKVRDEPTLSALERFGLLPNYTLYDDGVTLQAALWSTTADGDYQTELYEYTRPATLALRELAPGASFYAGGHRVRVDALELGPATEPAWEPWRLCPECGFGARDEAPLAACPRCDSQRIADAQSRHLLLPFTGSSAQGSEEDARISDESDDRERVPFNVVVSVDVDPADVRPDRAWRSKDEERPFGFEYAEATLRWVNLGPTDRTGQSVAVAGRDDLHASRFQTCPYCGVVQGAVDTFGRQPPAGGMHRGWCLTRGGSRVPVYQDVVLAHELRTEVVRIALPLADFEVTERLASLRAALLFGLQLKFGGTPDHLRVVVSDAPGGEDGGRRRFLVVHDIVPGGTGYLERLADPDTLREILSLARVELSLCPCRDEGRAACHRCLLGYADYGDADLVARRLALELLDELLAGWDLEPVATIGSLAIGAVEESELERRLRVALIAWAERTPGASVTRQPAASGFAELELRIPSATGGNGLRRWRVREQHALDTTPATRPDFVLERLDAPARPVALYSDGFAYHASLAHRDTLADDARKRHAVRSSGRLVWSVDWQDVESFRAAAVAESEKQPGNRPLLSGTQAQAFQAVHHQRGGALSPDVLAHNPLRALMRYLADPDLKDWRRLARSAVAGAFAASAPSPVADGLAFATPTLHGAQLSATLDTAGPDGADAERWSVRLLLPDGEEAVAETEHRDRWRDWLHWGNVLQFLDGDGCAALIATTSTAEDLTVGAVAIPTAALQDNAGLSAEQEEDLLLADAAVHDLLRAVGGAFVVGEEVADGAPVEVAWPDVHVAILVDGQAAPAGWDARHVGDWTEAALATAVGGVR